MAAWDIDRVPEFQALADGFAAAHPGLTVQLVEYPSGNDYTTAMLTDLAAGTAPNIVVMKTVADFVRFAPNNLLLPIDDVRANLDPATGSLEAYELNGVTYAVPYRQDFWVLYYNKDLFDEAGIAYPDGSWTWDDYYRIAEELSSALGQGRFGTYQHSWQSTIQGFALNQTPGASLFDGDFSWLAPFYERALAAQDAGAQQSFANVTTASLHHNSEFGLQNSAMVPMGTWFSSQILDAMNTDQWEPFNWGMAPIPQPTTATTGMNNVPLTFGGPTGLAINSRIDPSMIDCAKEFLEWAAGEPGAMVQAQLGLTPALITPAIEEAVFATPGMPQDEVSKFAFSTHEVGPENPTDERTAAVQGILNDLHSAVMSGSVPVEDAISQAEQRFTSEVR